MMKIDFSNVCHLIPDTVEKLYLFGSYARKTNTVYSDIDIAVLVSEDFTIYDKADLYCLFSEIFPDRDTSLFITTEQALTTTNCLDVNYSVREEGVLVWKK